MKLSRGFALSGGERAARDGRGAGFDLLRQSAERRDGAVGAAWQRGNCGDDSIEGALSPYLPGRGLFFGGAKAALGVYGAVDVPSAVERIGRRLFDGIDGASRAVRAKGRMVVLPIRMIQRPIRCSGGCGGSCCSRSYCSAGCRRFQTLCCLRWCKGRPR